jgi:hypothetical protein
MPLEQPKFQRSVRDFMVLFPARVQAGYFPGMGFFFARTITNRYRRTTVNMVSLKSKTKVYDGAG